MLNQKIKNAYLILFPFGLIGLSAFDKRNQVSSALEHFTLLVNVKWLIRRGIGKKNIFFVSTVFLCVYEYVWILKFHLSSVHCRHTNDTYSYCSGPNSTTTMPPVALFKHLHVFAYLAYSPNILSFVINIHHRSHSSTGYAQKFDWK